MSDPVIEFFTEKEWYDQDEISLNKRLAVRDFYQWLTSRPTPRAADGGYRPAQIDLFTPSAFSAEEG